MREHFAERADTDDRPHMATTWRAQAAAVSAVLASAQRSRRVPDRVLHAWASVVVAGYRGEASRRYTIEQLRRGFRHWLERTRPPYDYEREPIYALRIALNGHPMPGAFEGDVVGANVVGLVAAYGAALTALRLARPRETA